jgi:hypothetical protein
MLPNLALPVPGSLTGLLATFGPMFTAPSFCTFCGLACGFFAQTGKRTVCGTLVLDPENDQFFRGEPRRIFDALHCPKELITFSAAEGAGEHCQEGAGLLTEQRVFDRLDALLR